MNSRVAILDLGTNTFHLLIAEKTTSAYTIIHRERLAVRLGRGGINHDTILPDAIERAVATLITYRKIIDRFDAERIYAFGTSALRNAKNAQAVIDEIDQHTGIPVKIISGEQEAQLIYQGVNLALQLDDKPALIADIGGGSIELIIGNGTKIFWKQSFEIGGQRLLEKFTISDPITAGNILALNAYFEETLAPLFRALNTYNPETLAGSSGSFETLSDIYCAERALPKGNDETPFSLSAFDPIYQAIISKNRAERLRIPGMIELRVDLIVVGSCFINFLLTKHRFTTLRISRYSLQEGALAGLSEQQL